MSRNLWLFFIAAVLVSSCGETAAEIRRHTYAPSFRYLEEEQIRTAMGELSTQVVLLDRTIRGAALPTQWAGVGPGPADTTDPDRVVAILTEMIRTADRLEARALATNHPELSRDLDLFRGSLLGARTAAASRPPQYFLAGTITGACLYCHTP